ncbi:hypothetical protein QF038_002326 [Pseudarthrobacter sp. W1I19]|uniref:DUF5709 domain-containing protein n=1 Tax=Pseudarthrobacter sp. W1I19 TaxID=3042288 RepID=UPI002783621B|nr:DUF5709 domain-containing protein [Pseudarthrobacter sp. W1I19]MDQ0923818.1 hypothetical protein [Pseudarthrobacter sp. W1I19]
MPSSNDSNFFEYSAENFGLLPPDESLDGDELGDDIEETGYSPLDRRPADLSWGFTEREARSHESLSDRLAREIPEETGEFLGDGIGDTTDTDGELIDDQVGSVRAGRLTWAFPDSFDPAEDYLANDIGIDGGGASAEEAAMHIVIDPDDLP